MLCPDRQSTHSDASSPEREFEANLPEDRCQTRIMEELGAAVPKCFTDNE